MAVLSKRPTRGADGIESTRTGLLEAARMLIAEHGSVAGITVAEISAAAGVTRPTFYAYFRDKRDLVLALGAEMERDLRNAADPWLRGGSGDLGETLSAVLDGFRRHHTAVAAIVEAANYDDDVATFWRAFHQWFVDSGTTRALEANPDMTDEEASAAAFALVWMTERSVTEHIAAPLVNDAALLAAIERLWRSVIGPGPEGPHG